jgi:hypothetical protein
MCTHVLTCNGTLSRQRLSLQNLFKPCSISFLRKQAKENMTQFLNDNYKGNYDDDNNLKITEIMCNNNIPNYIKLLHKLNSTDIMEQLIIV